MTNPITSVYYKVKYNAPRFKEANYGLEEPTNHYHLNKSQMKEERYLKDREAIIRADIWKEITTSCKGLRTELGYTNVQIVDFLKEITKTFERDQL